MFFLLVSTMELTSSTFHFVTFICELCYNDTELILHVCNMLHTLISTFVQWLFADDTLLVSVICGIAAGVISSSVANPTDVLKVCYAWGFWINCSKWGQIVIRIRSVTITALMFTCGTQGWFNILLFTTVLFQYLIQNEILT